MNKPTALTMMDPATLRKMLSGGQSISRTNLIALAKWAIFQEIDLVEQERNHLRFGHPTPGSAKDQIEEMEERIEKQAKEHEEEIKEAEADFDKKIGELKAEHAKALQEADIIL